MEARPSNSRRLALVVRGDGTDAARLMAEKWAAIKASPYAAGVRWPDADEAPAPAPTPPPAPRSRRRKPKGKFKVRYECPICGGPHSRAEHERIAA